MKTDEIRKSFLDFFKSKSHKVVSSESLVSHDPTLLFTSAGMNQFKDKFMGKDLTYTKAASCQKCLRTGDLKNVGKTPRHHTFFEMLGNFSFGDYFKKEAINWAWEFLTKELKLSPQKLWVSVYKEDNEALSIWNEISELQNDKIIKLGQKENFWPANVQKEGPNGPCGPCSELFFDQGEEVGCGKPECNPACECHRFVEVWNLVFTQFERKNGGILEPLPRKNIDTGMGLERIAAVIQGVRSNFEIDIFKPIVEAIKDMSQEPRANSSSIYAIADHMRAIVFAISDGIVPSSEERGYVIRKLVNKSIRHGEELGIKEEFLVNLVPLVIETMKEGYPEIKKSEKEIMKILTEEEKKRVKIYFEDKEEYVVVKPETLSIESSVNKPEIKIKKKNKKVLSGKDIFKLHDTYGIHIEDIEKAAKENYLDIDREEFDRCMQEQKRRSRQKSDIKDEIFAKGKFKLEKFPKTKFKGYENISVESTVLGIIKNNEFKDYAKEGEKVFIILDNTPFYAETGGQVSDTGKVYSNKAELKVLNTVSEEDRILHESKVLEGALHKGSEVKAEVNKSRRLNIACNHTATHLLHWALRKVLGDHVKQSGSLVTPEKLRFDFNHFRALTAAELNEIEELVNKKVRENKKLRTEIKEKEKAKNSGALAFFKQKYGEEVRVVEIGDFSKELCGGTHLGSTGEIGVFKIVNETSVASGIRRIEAITGEKAYQSFKESEKILLKLSHLLRSDRLKLVEIVKEKLETIKYLSDKIEGLTKKIWKKDVENIINEAKEYKGIKIVTHKLHSIDMNGLGKFSDLITDHYNSFIVIVGSEYEDKALLVCGISDDIVKKGYKAEEIIKKVAKIVKGGGGGKPSFAQAGGKDVSKLNAALGKAEGMIIEYIKNKKVS